MSWFKSTQILWLSVIARSHAFLMSLLSTCYGRSLFLGRIAIPSLTWMVTFTLLQAILGISLY